MLKKLWTPARRVWATCACVVQKVIVNDQWSDVQLRSVTQTDSAEIQVADALSRSAMALGLEYAGRSRHIDFRQARVKPVKWMKTVGVHPGVCVLDSILGRKVCLDCVAELSISSRRKCATLKNTPPLVQLPKTTPPSTVMCFNFVVIFHQAHLRSSSSPWFNSSAVHSRTPMRYIWAFAEN